MDKTQAMDRVLGEQQLALLERIILLQMIKNSGMDNVCSLSKSKLAELCASRRATVSAAMGRLEAEGLLVTVQKKGYTAQYIPFPYCENLIKSDDKEKGGSRLTITPDQGKILLGLLLKEENALTLIAREAQSRRDLAEHKRTCVQIDAIFDIKDTVERFVQRTTAKG